MAKCLFEKTFKQCIEPRLYLSKTLYNLFNTNPNIFQHGGQHGSGHIQFSRLQNSFNREKLFQGDKQLGKIQTTLIFCIFVKCD